MLGQTTLILSLAAALVRGQSSAEGSATQAISGGGAVSGTAAASGSAAAGTSIDSNLPQTPQTTIAGVTVPALSEITSGAPTQPPVPLQTTYTAGSPMTYVSAAPSLPNIATLNPANYPALDVIPPTNSSEVQGWLSAIDFSKVPTYSVTDGTCAGSQSAITDGRCWWTCGGCTRQTDITECPDKFTWGLSYDDGPSPYTPLILDYLAEVNIKTTFFVVGSRVISRPEMVQSEYVQGHQISVHTWSHHPLTNLTNEQIVAELGWTKKVIKDVIGVTPNTFRPPYGDIDDRVRAIAAQMGLTPIIWTSVTANGTTTNFDTTDWNIPGGTATGETALGKFETILNTYVPQLSTGFIVLQHDLYQSTVDLAVGYVMPAALASKYNFQLKSIINCLGYPLSEAYIETSSNTTQTLITSAQSTFFQASVGSGTGSVVTATGTGADAVKTSGTASNSAGSAAATTSRAAAGHRAEFNAAGVVPGLAALAAVGAGMAYLL